MKIVLLRVETTCNWVKCQESFMVDTVVSVVRTGDMGELLYTSDLDEHLFMVFVTACLILQTDTFSSIAHKGETNFYGSVLHIQNLVCHIMEATDLGRFSSVLQRKSGIKRKEKETNEVLQAVKSYYLHRLLNFVMVMKLGLIRTGHARMAEV